ncbi:uncharacterized protein LTR77_005225 [Saxophila tyrrhenica]|uniref:Zn(2)-C6 fungal-type domain-containing protein n=1 Tax=Saxophila tyrrhenica TaxID=1690608 RepID=A0AAV9PBT4_9PEZI|nr:hypothetical protein LTR77_005225 [Saxophila tyrrhenica]
MSMLSMMEQRPIAIAPKKDQATNDDDSSAKEPAKNGEEACMLYTCLTCARRKVKCDKAIPICSTCRKARLDCTYQEPAPRKRKRKPVDDVHERLEQYEKILKANGLLPGAEGQKSSDAGEPQWPFLVTNATSTTLPINSKPGKLIGKEDKARYIGSSVFKTLGDDLEPSSDEDDEGDEEPQPSSFQQIQAPDPLSLAFLSPGTSVSLLNYHPTYETAMRLWKTYVDNADPVVKAVHVPTMQKILQRAAAQPSRIPKATEALMFAIYHFAVITMEEDDCRQVFGESRASLLARYEAALRQALVNAQFLKSTNLAVIQAFELFLLAVRSFYDPQAFWILTGVAVRMAQRIGLHRDGNELGLGPFDTQMRRRIFWQLLPLDGLAGQLSGTGICITLDSWTTEPPLNLNDTDIWPEMTHQPEPHTGATDMIFCLARTEMAKIVRTAFTEKGATEDTAKGIVFGGEQGDFKLKDDSLTRLEDAMETKYLRYCDFANPIHLLTMAMARSGINGGRLRVRLPRAKASQDLPDSERREIWSIANKILDYHISANSNPHLKRFHWHIKAFFQSEALAWILNELRKDPARYKDDETIWTRIETTYGNHTDLAEQKRSLHLAVGRLTLKAWDATQAFRQQTGRAPLPEPAYITTIRLRPHRRDTHASNSSNPTPESQYQYPTQTQAQGHYQYNPFNPGDSSEDLPPPPGPLTAVSNSNSNSSITDPLNPSTGFTFGDTNAPMTNSFDFDFNQVVDPNTGSIDWTFWDTLMREPSAVPPSIGLGMTGRGGGGGGTW